VENNHLRYFKIENFKKFDSLEVNDIGQFNLIVGDNNVGKTCLLEALLFDKDDSKFSIFLMESLLLRGLIDRNVIDKNHIKYELPKNSIQRRFFKNQLLPIIYNYREVSNEKHEIFVDVDDRNFELKPNRELKITNNLVLSMNFENESILNFPFIGFNSTSERDIYNLYNNLKTKRDKENLIKTIQVVDINVIDIELRQNFDDLKSVFLISFEDKDEFVPLNFLGDGFKRIFYIVLKTLSLKGKRIMIDEIEIGIHHSKMKDFWVNIMKVCKELDVQLFATTHSQECISSFLEASKELNEKNIRLIRLQENKDQSIKAICYKEEYIEYMVESNTEER
jgi:AAA15 family ATPase/GTPase